MIPLNLFRSGGHTSSVFGVEHTKDGRRVTAEEDTNNHLMRSLEEALQDAARLGVTTELKGELTEESVAAVWAPVREALAKEYAHADAAVLGVELSRDFDREDYPTEDVARVRRELGEECDRREKVARGEMPTEVGEPDVQARAAERATIKA